MCDVVCDASSGLPGAAGGEQLPQGGGEVLCANFNQDFSSLCLGTSSSYQIFDFSKGDELVRLCDNHAVNCCMVQRLYSSSLVAVVSRDQCRKLNVNHFKKNSHICSYTYTLGILNVLLNRERLVVVCEDRLSIHVVKDMELIHNITETPLNRTGLSALANSTKNCYLAYPGSDTAGVVQIFDAYNLKSGGAINAHDSPLQCMAFNDQGTLLATASQKGTVIRVFEVSGESGRCTKKLYELRRGISRSATIYSLSFSADSRFLLASSNTSTIHIFRLQELPAQDGSSTPASSSGSSAVGAAASSAGGVGTGYASTVYSMFSSAVSASAAYLPSQVAGMMTQERAFAWASLPSEGKVTKVALTSIQKVPRVVAATMDGMVYIYDFNSQHGGECKLVKQHNLNPHLPSGDELQEVATLDQPSSLAEGVRGSSLDPLSSPATVDSLGSSVAVNSSLASISANTAVLALDDPEQFPPV